MSSSISVAHSTASSQSEDFESASAERGALEEHVIQKTPDLTSKWWGVAIAVGILVVIGSGFGIVGLLQTYQFLQLPPSFQWLASAIGIVSQALPSNGGLWMIAVIGGALGLTTTGISSAKVHQRRGELQKIEEEKEEAKEHFLREFFSENNPNLPSLEAIFTHNPPEFYQLLRDGDNFYIVLNHHEKVRSAGPLSDEKARECIEKLESFGFKDILAQANFSQSLLWEDSSYNHLMNNSFLIDERENEFKIIRRTSKGQLEKSQSFSINQKRALQTHLQYDHYFEVSLDDLKNSEKERAAIKSLGYSTQFPETLDKKNFANLPRGRAIICDYTNAQHHQKKALIFKLSNNELFCKSNIDPIPQTTDHGWFGGVIVTNPSDVESANLVASLQYNPFAI